MGPIPQAQSQAMLSLYLFNDRFCFPPQLSGLLVEALVYSIEDLLCNFGHLGQALVVKERLEDKRRTKSPLD